MSDLAVTPYQPQPAATALRERVIVGAGVGLLAGLASGFLGQFPVGMGVYLLISISLGIAFAWGMDRLVTTPGTALVWAQAYGLAVWVVLWLTLYPLVTERRLAWDIEAARANFGLLLAQGLAFGVVLGLGYFFARWAWRTWQARHASTQPSTSETSADKEATRSPVIAPQGIVAPRTQALIVGGLGGIIGSWLFARGIQTVAFYPLVAELVGSEAVSIGRLLHYLIGLTIGLSFGFLFYKDLHNVGASLVWGINYGLVWWLLGPLTLFPWFLGNPVVWSLEAAQAATQGLIAHLLYGSVLGFFYGFINRIWRLLFVDSDPLQRSSESAGTRGTKFLLYGQLAGIAGGVLFTLVTIQAGMLRGTAQLLGMQSAGAGLVIHLIVAMIIGSSYGILFERRETRLGSSIAWGLSYGFFWWLLGSLTLFPAFLRLPVDWSNEAVSAGYVSLVGHLLYGLTLGVIFQVLSSRRRPAAPTLRGKAIINKPLTSNEAPASAALWVVVILLGVMLPLLLAGGVVIGGGYY
jgi:uncharacterized membrane protein YagU involved in acid resistance